MATSSNVASGTDTSIAATSIGSRLRGDIRRELYPRRGPAKLLTAFACFWLVSAVFHLGVFYMDDTAWAGSVSWRKPIVFSVSIGLLLWSYGWILDRLPDRRRLAWGLAVPMAVSSTLENALIIMQTWRGRASHFNLAEPGDALIFGLMGTLVAIMSVLIVALFVWTLRRRPAHAPDRLAAIAGLAIVITGLGFGQWLVSLGTAYFEQFGSVPDQVVNGEAGVPKFPHAVAFHGIQVFMIAAMLLGSSAASTQAQRVKQAQRTMRAVVASYTGVLVFVSAQTILGRAPFDLNLLAGALLVASVVGLVVSLAYSGWLWLTAPANRPAPATTTGPGQPPAATLLR